MDYARVEVEGVIVVGAFSAVGNHLLDEEIHHHLQPLHRELRGLLVHLRRHLLLRVPPLLGLRRPNHLRVLRLFIEPAAVGGHQNQRLHIAEALPRLLLA